MDKGERTHEKFSDQFRYADRDCDLRLYPGQTTPGRAARTGRGSGAVDGRHARGPAGLVGGQGRYRDDSAAPGLVLGDRGRHRRCRRRTGRAAGDGPGFQADLVADRRRHDRDRAARRRDRRAVLGRGPRSGHTDRANARHRQGRERQTDRFGRTRGRRQRAEKIQRHRCQCGDPRRRRRGIRVASECEDCRWPQVQGGPARTHRRQGRAHAIRRPAAWPQVEPQQPAMGYRRHVRVERFARFGIVGRCRDDLGGVSASGLSIGHRAPDIARRTGSTQGRASSAIRACRSM